MSVKVVYEDVAVGSAAAASVTASEAMGISKTSLLPFGAFEGPVATTEQNQWVLNGTRKLKPKSEPVGFWSTTRSGDDCTFTVPPTITITLDGQFTSLGIYFKFDGETGDYCSDLNITWYNGTTQLATQQFFPNSGNYFCEKTVELYNKIKIQFNKTNLPNQPIKVSLILFGIVREFDRQELRSVEATEELNIISDELAINTLDFTLDSMEDIDFIFQEKQPVYAYNGKTKIGTFYIDESTRVSKNVYNVSCIDALGILDEDPFPAVVYSKANAKTVLESILGGYFVLELSEELRTEKLTGYVQIDGTKYTSAGTYQIPAGAEITVVCGADSSYVYANGFKITQNGTTVAHGTGTSPISYTLSLTMPVEIAFTKHVPPFGSSSFYWSCEITTS